MSEKRLFPNFHAPFLYRCNRCATERNVCEDDLVSSSYYSRTGYYEEEYSYLCDGCDEFNDIEFNGSEFDDSATIQR